MALDLEQEIMREIGLGQHYNWHNGSGGCRATRQAAVVLLPARLREHGLRVDEDLLRRARAIAERGEQSDASLTKTWEICSEIITFAIHEQESSQAAMLILKADILRLWPGPEPYRWTRFGAIGPG